MGRATARRKENKYKLELKKKKNPKHSRKKKVCLVSPPQSFRSACATRTTTTTSSFRNWIFQSFSLLLPSSIREKHISEMGTVTGVFLIRESLLVPYVTSTMSLQLLDASLLVYFPSRSIDPCISIWLRVAVLLPVVSCERKHQLERVRVSSAPLPCVRKGIPRNGKLNRREEHEGRF
jgi:hypothetical protein